MCTRERLDYHNHAWEFADLGETNGMSSPAAGVADLRGAMDPAREACVERVGAAQVRTLLPHLTSVTASRRYTRDEPGV